MRMRGAVKEQKQFVVYMLASKPNGTLYIGVTSNLAKRIAEHRTGSEDGFTAKYKVDRLVWFEHHDTAESAIPRERRMKKWRRAWKVALIEERNPHWRDLAEELEI